MNFTQEFVVDNLKIVQDEQQWGILQNCAPGQAIEGQWEVIATFKYAIDAVNYFSSYINEAAAKKAYAQNSIFDGPTVTETLE